MAIEDESNTRRTCPQISLCDADPKAPFAKALAASWRKGLFTEVAVAFLTKGGVEFFEDNCLGHQDSSRCVLCFAVQWPTNLEAVARLFPLLGSNLKIHLGLKTPVESGTDVTPLMHSKVVLTHNSDGTCTAFVGSHNWTANALNGINCEASVRVDCNSSDDFALQLREHIQSCSQQCVPFDPADLTYYKALQRVLSSAKPPAPDADQLYDFESLEGSPAVIIHAEGDEECYRDGPVKLFLPVKKQNIAKWFSTTTPTNIFLFLYSKGTLFGHEPPTTRPILFHGPVGTNNDVSVSPSRETDVTCEIRNFDWPEVVEVASRNIPPVDDEQYQVVAELRRLGPAVVPIYHRGKRPMLEVGVDFKESTISASRMKGEEADSLENPVGQYGPDSMRHGVFVFSEPTPERVMHLDVPERWLYAEDVEEILRRRLTPNLPQGGVRIDLKVQKRTNAYVYQASFVINH